jgi:hypothetical protein
MSRSSWSLLVSDVVFTSLYNKQSSAKSLAEECKFSGRSFRKTIKQDYTIHNHILEVVEESKYLGVTISKDLTWKARINNITNKANKTL